MDVKQLKVVGKNSSSFLWLSLIIVFISILMWRDSTQFQSPDVDKLPEPPSVQSLAFLKASDSSFVYRLMLFWLQQFDVQSGQYVSYRHLDYQRVIAWLRLLDQMEPESQYPMLLATRIYTKVADKERLRMMLDYIYQGFKSDPVKNWRWLAEATVLARHRLNDQDLALIYATALAEETNKEIPHWARDMRLIILEDKGEIEQVKLLVGGLMASKTITDTNEIRFLELLLHRLQKNDK